MIPSGETGGTENDGGAGTDDDVVVTKDAAIEKAGTNEPQVREQNMIQKALTFWNHPSLKDVPSSEKRLYLQEQQGLTNAQIHKVWEEVVATPRAGSDTSNSTTSNIHPHNTAPQHYSAHPQHPQYHNHHYQSPSAPNTNFGQYFNSKQSPSSYYYDYPHNNTMGDGRHQPFPTHPNDHETDASISVPRGLSLLTVGGALGVTGAAAVRWLNGGRFELFPSNTRTSDAASKRTVAQVAIQEEKSNQSQAASGENPKDGTKWNADRGNLGNEENYEEEEDDEDDDYNDGDYSDNEQEDGFDLEECLIERMDALLSSIDSNSVLQEKLIHKLANTSTITDESMSLLKQNKDVTKAPNTTETAGRDSKTLAELKEVRESLVNLCNSITSADSENGKKEDWQEEWSKLLAKFDNCIQALEEPIDSFFADSEAGDTKSTSTAETTQTENPAKQETVQLLPPAPATPATGNESGISSSDMTATLMPLSLSDCIVKLVENNNSLNLKSGSQLLYLYLANLSGKPDNRRYRKIFTSNESFKKVETMIGGKDLLCAVGFVEDSEKGVLEWVPTGSTEEEISALILVKEAAAALGVLKKANNAPSSDLIRSALSKLSSTSSPPFSVPPSPPPPGGNGDNSESEKRVQDQTQDIPQTPIGSSLLSPPMPKKMPFVPTPSDNMK